MNVYTKLNHARERFHGRQLKKSGHNKFAGYNYFELGDFIVPALEIFKDVGLTSIISFGKESADMRIINTDKPEEVIIIETPMSTAALKGCHEVQNLGAVQTYLRRYLWVAALEIVEHDALDSSEGVAKTMDQNSILNWVAAIEGCADKEQLKVTYMDAINAAGDDAAAKKKIIAAKDKMKAVL